MKSFKEYLTEKQFSESTVKIYENGTKEFLEWITKHQYQTENIRYADLMNYIKHSQKKGKSKVNVQHQLLAIRHYFNYLVKVREIKSNPAQGVYIRGIARRLPHDLAEYEELIKLYENYPVNDIRDQRNKVILGLLIFQAVTIEELELLESEHINLREGKIKVPGTDRTNERVLKLEAAQVFEMQEYLNKTRNRILYGPKVNEPEKIKQLIIGMEGGTPEGGKTDNFEVELDMPTKEGFAKKSVITINVGTIDALISTPKNKFGNVEVTGLSFDEVLGAVLGHEIEHTTGKSIFKDATGGDAEVKSSEPDADIIGDKILNETIQKK